MASFDFKTVVEVVHKGGIMLYPTETIWGLGCDATKFQSIDKIFEIKERPANKSMIVLVNSTYMIEQYVEKVPEIAWQLLEVSDEPLTIVYPKGKNLAEQLFAEDGSIAIRITNHPFCKELISRLKRPIVSTSANISGMPNPTHFNSIDPKIKSKVDFVVDQNDFRPLGNKPSAIIKLGLGGEIEIIRK